MSTTPDPKSSPPGEGALYVALGLIFVLILSVKFFGPIVRNKLSPPNQQGMFTACKSNLKNIATAYEMYSTDWDGAYPESLSILTPNYLKTVARCPAAQESAYKVECENHDLGKGRFAGSYLIQCEGEHHASVGARRNFPQYSSTEGLIEK